MATTSDVEPFKLALCQLQVTADKDENIANASKAVKEAASKGANIVSIISHSQERFGLWIFFFPHRRLTSASTSIGCASRDVELSLFQRQLSYILRGN